MKFGFHPEAFAEHQDSVAFYQERLPGLGADYVADFNAVMSVVCQHPDRFPKIGEPAIHRANLKRFPFHVIYRVMLTQIVVLAIAHHRRRPAYWVERAGK